MNTRRNFLLSETIWKGAEDARELVQKTSPGRPLARCLICHARLSIPDRAILTSLPVGRVLGSLQLWIHVETSTKIDLQLHCRDT